MPPDRRSVQYHTEQYRTELLRAEKKTGHCALSKVLH
jgi:hypothetical protein